MFSYKAFTEVIMPGAQAVVPDSVASVPALDAMETMGFIVRVPDAPKKKSTSSAATKKPASADRKNDETGPAGNDVMKEGAAPAEDSPDAPKSTRRSTASK